MNNGAFKLGPKLAFTLIELLVVMSIIAILSSMIFVARETPIEELVTGDALALSATLQRARSLALSTGNTHGVAFHIENAGDGSVLKNRSVFDKSGEAFVSRHWYALIGPDSEAENSDYRERRGSLPPLLKSSHGDRKTFATIADYAEAFEKAQLGPRQYLSAGVRFLALSDIDNAKILKKNGNNYDVDPAGHATYPRPWFGYYDKVSNTLYPWGAYNREIDAALDTPATGLDYQGHLDKAPSGHIDYSATLDTNINPDQVWGRMHYTWDWENEQGSGAIAANPAELSITKDKQIYSLYTFARPVVGPDTTYTAKKPRPLVNAYWCDFMIFFSPNGSAKVTSAHVRRLYHEYGASYERNKHHFGRQHMGLEFEDDRTGGFSITLCRDIDDDAGSEVYPEGNVITGQPAYNKFNSVEDAFESINPFVRVYVDRFTGISSIRKNEHPTLQITAEDLADDSKDPYPRMK